MSRGGAPRVLVTGFEAFAGMASNPTQRLVRELPDEVEGLEVVTRVLPVSFTGARDAVRRALDETEPDAVLCLGLAAGRVCVTPERVGVNVAHVEPVSAEGGHDRADNDGATPRHRPVLAEGPDALLSTLDPAGLTAALLAAGVPAAVSESAGTYVCNTVLFSVLHHLRSTGRGGVPAGFVHVPATPDLACEDPRLASMAPELLDLGLRVALRHAAGLLAGHAPVR